MTLNASKIGRKIIGLIAAIVCYYIVHEGAHLIFALCTGTFEKIVFMFPGIQIKANVEFMTNFQLGIFNLLGAVATISLAYILCICSSKVSQIKSNLVRAVLYYVTIVLLLCDAIYLSVLCGYFGGGDINGISLLIPEMIAKILFGCIGIINLFIVVRVVVPNYKEAFKINNNY